MVKLNKSFDSVESCINASPYNDDIKFVALKLLSKAPTIGNHLGIPSMASGFLYLAHRKLRLPVCMDQISSDFYKIDVMLWRRDVGKAFKKIKKYFSMRLCKEEVATLFGTSCVALQSVEDFIRVYAEKLFLSEKYIQECLDIYSLVKDRLNCLKPNSLACGVIYYVINKNGLKSTQREVADECYVTECCVRNNYIKFKELVEHDQSS